jgi:multicomponent Na+:H+ antiporter subunit G
LPIILFFRDFISIILIVTGVFFFIVSTIGILRLPDVYTRLHAAAKADTLGAGLTLLGVALYLGFSPKSLKLLLIIGFIWLTNPTAAHLIGRSAYQANIKPANGDFDIYDVSKKEDK